MYFNAYEIKMSYTLIHEVAILGYSAPMLCLCGVDAVAPVSHNGSKYFQILSFGLPCMAISCEDANTRKAMAQQFSKAAFGSIHLLLTVQGRDSDPGS